MKIEGKEWEQCVAFHGHECSGLAIGYKAVLLAREKLGLTKSSDEQFVCITECDACCNDAIQIMTGCTTGKGNLLFHMTGKFAFTFYSRKTGEGIRLAMNYYDGNDPAASETYYWNTEPSELFRETPVRIPLPERAKVFKSVRCSVCGEKAAENHMRMQNGEYVCKDCFTDYQRPLV